MSLSATKCVSCGALLTPLQVFSGLTCDRLDCRGPYLQSRRFQQLQREKKERDAIARRARRQLPILIPNKIPTAVVPSNQRRLEDVAAHRRSAFAEHIRQKLQFARALLQDSARRETVQKELVIRKADPNDCESATCATACAVCRGYCCTSGHDHAYLGSGDMEQMLVYNEHMSDEQMVDEYESHIPERAYEDSCLFHTAQGCALPAKWRSRTCHDFLCSGLREAKQDSIQSSDPACFVVSMDDSEVIRMTYVDAEGQHHQWAPGSAGSSPGQS